MKKPRPSPPRSSPHRRELRPPARPPQRSAIQSAVRVMATPTVRWHRPMLTPGALSGSALALMVGITLAAYLFSAVHQQGSWLLAADWLDNGTYIAASKAIRTGQWLTPTDTP